MQKPGFGAIRFFDSRPASGGEYFGSPQENNAAASVFGSAPSSNSQVVEETLNSADHNTPTLTSSRMESSSTAYGKELCPNTQCKCPDCTCGLGCTCGVSMEVVCDPCADFKKAAPSRGGTLDFDRVESTANNVQPNIFVPAAARTFPSGSAGSEASPFPNQPPQFPNDSATSIHYTVSQVNAHTYRENFQPQVDNSSGPPEEEVTFEGGRASAPDENTSTTDNSDPGKAFDEAEPLVSAPSFVSVQHVETQKQAGDAVVDPDTVVPEEVAWGSGEVSAPIVSPGKARPPKLEAADLSNALCVTPSVRGASSPIKPVFNSMRKFDADSSRFANEGKFPSSAVEQAKQHLKLTLDYRKAMTQSATKPRKEADGQMASIAQMYARRLASLSLEHAKLLAKCKKLEAAVDTPTPFSGKKLELPTDNFEGYNSPVIVPSGADKFEADEEDEEEWGKIQTIIQALEGQKNEPLEALPEQVEPKGNTVELDERVKTYEIVVAHANRLSAAYESGEIVELKPIKDSVIDVLVGKAADVSQEESWDSLQTLLVRLGCTRMEIEKIKEYSMLDDMIEEENNSWSSWVFGQSESSEDFKERKRRELLALLSNNISQQTNGSNGVQITVDDFKKSVAATESIVGSARTF
jgi:hypothetical protein